MHEAFSGFSLGEMSSDEIHHKLKSSFENFFNIELYPDALNDPRLEYSFKSPDCREPEMLPAIWKDYGYEETADGVKIISAKSAKIASDVYLHYVDEETIVWDADRKEMFLYIPDMENPRLAFKGTSWICARKLKDEYSHLNLYDVYMEIKRTIDQDRINN
jgi:hypothetical protein